MATPRVLTVCNWFPPRYVGGAEVSAFYTVHGLRQRGYNVDVLSIWARGSESSNTMRTFRGIPVHEVLLPRSAQTGSELFDPRVYQYVLDEIRQRKPDLVHIHNVSGMSLAPFAACRKLGVPVVMTLHDHWLLCAANMLYQEDGALCGSISSWSGCGKCFRRYDHWADVPLRRKLFSLATSGVTRFITPSGALRDLHVRSGYDASRFAVVPYGISPDVQISTEQSADGAATSARLRGLLRESSNVVLFSGVLVETKGLDTLIEAAPLMEQYAGPVQLWIAGGGEGRYVERLHALRSVRVELLGKLMFDTVRTVYGAAGLTVVPSVWYDNSPVVIYESLLAGTPVLGSTLGGISELIEEGHTGYLVPPRDPAALAEKVILHFAQPAARRRDMRRACVEYATRRLSLDTHVDAVGAVYAEALAS
jgi:glycosyltransferase involved in cell wall biosynthesis